MKFIFKIFLFFLAVVIGFLSTIFIYFKINKVNVNKIVSPLITSELSLFNAPSDSLTGKITGLSGTILWTARDNNQQLITKPQNIQQGEEVETGTNSSLKMAFNNIVFISISANSKLSIIQTLPANLVFNQLFGKLEYEKLNSSIPVSVRALDLLININDGESEISVDKNDSTIKISIKTGDVTIAFTDTNNKTIIQNIKSGEDLIFNNNSKTFTTNP